MAISVAIGLSAFIAVAAEAAVLVVAPPAVALAVASCVWLMLSVVLIRRAR